jgi:hypothetical protein
MKSSGVGINMIGGEALTRNLEQKKASAQDQRQAQAKQQ